MTDELHCDSYAVAWPDDDAADGGLMVRPDQTFHRVAPSPLGQAMEANEPGSYWPRFNGYSMETPPHAEGECEAHRPQGRWKRETVTA